MHQFANIFIFSHPAPVEPKPEGISHNADKPALNGGDHAAPPPAPAPAAASLNGSIDNILAPIKPIEVAVPVNVAPPAPVEPAVAPAPPAPAPEAVAAPVSAPAPLTSAPAPSAPEPRPVKEEEPVKSEPAPAQAPAAPVAEVKPAPSADTKMEDAPAPKPEVAAPAAPAAAPEDDVQDASVSQLNLDTQPEDTVMQSVEVSMSDAPSSKIAREREEDAADEPAFKRTRTEGDGDLPIASTETKTEESAAPAAVASAVATPAGDEVATPSDLPAVEPPKLSSLHKWDDAEANSRELTQYRRKEIRKLIGRAKKTKSGANFKDAVPKMWPQLADAYLAKISNPVDLSLIERKTKDDSYETLGDLKEDLGLIFTNTLAFNGAAHDITGSAFTTVKMVWEEAMPMPAEEPAKPKHIPKAKPVREIRTPGDSTPRRAGSAADRGSQDVERGSADADRPKRNVRAPKPKDIDYTTKPSRKKLKPEIQFCFEVMDDIMHPKNEALIEWFKVPVDAEGLNIPQYYSIIKHPMDLGKVNSMLQNGEFASLKEFDKTVRLIFENCYVFNGPVDQGNPVSLRAKALENFYNNMMKGKDAWLAKHAAKLAAAAPTSNASDDEDDEDEDMDDAPAMDNSKEIQELQTKLQEETSKLHAMFVPGANQSLIDIQKGIVDMVQAALMKAVASGGDAGAPSARGGKRGGRGGRGGGRGGRGAKAQAPPNPNRKKPGPKKRVPKQVISAADKDAIANAINDLEYPHLDRAIDIIKKDTGQNENNDGELELDIDQLSTDALVQLWELCRSALDGFGKDELEIKTIKVAPPGTAPGKPKKNKPMSAQEQEARIAQLTALRQMYKDGGDAGEAAAAAASLGMTGAGAESSDDSDSEEE